MTTATKSAHKATLIHKEDQIYSYRGGLFAKNKEAATPVEAWLVNVNGVEHKARTKAMAKEIIDYVVEANQPELELEAPAQEEKPKAKKTKADVKANILKEREAAVQETYTILEVAEAMKATNGLDGIVCWYNDPTYYKPINYGVQQGWLSRVSTTQVYWTEAGIEAYKATQEVAVEVKEEASTSSQDVDVLKVMNTISFGVQTNKSDYKKSPMEEGLETLIPAVKMWERDASTTDKTGKVRIYMSKKLFNKPNYRKQIRTLSESLKEKYGTEIVVTMYDINKYMTMVDNRIEAHEFVLAFHYLNGWIGKDATTATKALLKDY